MNNTKDDGGAAFPTNGYDSPNHGWQHGQDGMSLRDYFAAAALQGLMNGYHSHPNGVKLCSEIAYEAADAMLQARKEGA